MNEMSEIRYNKILAEIKTLTFILEKCSEKIILNKANKFFTNEELFFFLSKRINEFKEKVVNLGKLLEV